MNELAVHWTVASAEDISVCINFEAAAVRWPYTRRIEATIFWAILNLCCVDGQPDSGQYQLRIELCLYRQMNVHPAALFFTVDGIDANQTQGNNCGVTKNPKEPPPDGERPAVFLFHGGRKFKPY